MSSVAGDKTTSFTTDDVGNPEPVTPNSYCRKVKIFETALAATSDYYVYRGRVGQTAAQVLASVTPIRKAAGTEEIFEDAVGFPPGVPIAFVAAVSGSFSMQQLEN